MNEASDSKSHINWKSNLSNPHGVRGERRTAARTTSATESRWKAPSTSAETTRRLARGPSCAHIEGGVLGFMSCGASTFPCGFTGLCSPTLGPWFIRYRYDSIQCGVPFHNRPSVTFLSSFVSFFLLEHVSICWNARWDCSRYCFCGTE